MRTAKELGASTRSAGSSKPMHMQRVTPRELEVLRHLADGCTYSQIADLLGITMHTVAAHIKSVYRKLDVHSSRAAIWRAVQLRLLGVFE